MKTLTLAFFINLLINFKALATITLHLPDDWLAGVELVHANENNVRIAWDNAYNRYPNNGERVIAVFNKKIQQEFYNSGIFGGYKWNADSAATTWVDPSTPSTGGSGGGNPCMAPTGCDEEEPYYDPLIIDLHGDGFHFGLTNIYVTFDYLNNGTGQQTQWVKPNENDAFVVLDSNNNGIVDSGQELFGTYPISNNKMSEFNGFKHLAMYDSAELGGNLDGQIDNNDAIWPYLKLWLDTNADGISTKDETIALQDYQINKLPTTYKDNNRIDHAGNKIPYWQWVINSEATNIKYKIVDVFFKGKSNDSFTKQ